MASGQTLPRSAEAYHAAQRAEIDRALRAVGRQWRKIRPSDVAASWDAIRPGVLAILFVAQGRLARPTGDYVSSVLRETGLGHLDDVIAEVSPVPLIGFAGDGRPLEGLVDLAPRKMLDIINRADGPGPRVAWETAERWLNLASSTALSDTARQAEVLQTSVRPGVDGYVRMLNPPSCSRCAILAGRFYRKNQGFLRHPGCDCRHIPASEATAGDLRLDPVEYFASLPTAAELAEQYPDLKVHERRGRGLISQEDVFTRDGATVIRAGADPVQVVNARRGMTTAQTPSGRRRLVAVQRYGQDVFVTTEGTTKYGLAYRKKTGRRSSERLMPESIVQLAEDQDDLLRLLKLHGYLR